jgi:hypothetical protein
MQPHNVRVTGTGTAGYGFGSAFADPVPGSTRVRTPLENEVNKRWLTSLLVPIHIYLPPPAVAHNPRRRTSKRATPTRAL